MIYQTTRSLGGAYANCVSNPPNGSLQTSCSVGGGVSNGRKSNERNVGVSIPIDIIRIFGRKNFYTSYHPQNGILVNYKRRQWDYALYRQKYPKRFLGLLSQYNDNIGKHRHFEMEQYHNIIFQQTTLDGNVSCLDLRNEVVA